MACHAARTHGCRVFSLRRFLLVAAFALHLFVRTVQWIFGTFGVVKLPDRPGTGVVAALAALAKLELVLIFFFVAGIAVARCVPEQGVLVAVLANDGNVFSGQRKPAQVMVELVNLP